MTPAEFVTLCATAFVVVFLLLTFLAVLIRLITLLFRERVSESDAAVVAAVIATIQAVCPGTKVTKVKEEK